jgi:hypothetical protein
MLRSGPQLPRARAYIKSHFHRRSKRGAVGCSQGLLSSQATCRPQSPSAMSHHPQLSATSSTDEMHGSLIRRSWHAMSDLLSPFSPSALAQLPKKPRRPSRYTRADEIPDVEPTEDDGQMPTVRDYHSITVPPQVRVPKKTPTPVRVESKVWFANERSRRCFLLLHHPSSLFCCCPVTPLEMPFSLFPGVFRSLCSGD